MDLTLRQLVFLEHEMEKIVNSKDRDSEGRSYASSVLERVEEELQRKEGQHNI
ncbi:hypothetical protein [Halorubrum sp. PV6]|uniref:hypothetical protein n=1 Tax=Halorubrum sp. PV6 TaxID=634157 RepID=UPI00130492AE|nr:hypothetical protein [Halorubrum sp. PV6]